MPNTFNSTTLSTVYNDDWNDSDGYHKILFNSGRSLQARELTQLQTIIQEEITRFGKNIFKEGAAVSKGLMEIDNNYRYVRALTSGQDVTAITPGTLLTGATNGVTARVIENVVLGSGESRLYIRYTGSGSAAAGATEIQFVENESLNSGAYVVGPNIGADVGAGVRLTVDSGDFFATGRFVHAPKQSLILAPTSRNYTGTVGFEIVQDVITVNDTTALYDNTGDTPNVAAPGADRWRIRLVLSDKANVSSSDSFVFLCRIVNSQIVEQVDELDNYNTINDMLARRTYEESGNYLAEPFQLTFEDDDSTDSDIFAVIGPGLAYVRGYRVENDYPKKLKIKRPQQTETINPDFVAPDYGSFVIATGDLDFDIWADGNGEREVNLYTSGGVTQGTAHVKTISKKNSAEFRVYLDNIIIDTGSNQSFDQVARIGDSFATSFEIVTGRLYEGTKQTSLFPLPTSRPSVLTGYSYTYQKSYTSVSSGSPTAGGLTSDENFVDESDWLVVDANGTIQQSATITDNGTSFTLGGTTGSSPFTVVANVNRDNVSRRTKERLQDTCTGALSSGELNLTAAGDGGAIVYDAYDIVSVVDATSGLDITAYFYLDNGQRDTHYEQAKIIKASGAAVTSGNITVTFRYFKWSDDVWPIASNSGLYFDVQSYTNIDYTEIPDHKLTNGTVINLRDYVDFRGKRVGSYIQSANPVVTQPIRVNASYYLSRADKLIATEEGEFEILMGQQAREPLFKKTPDNALELYKIVMNPNTLSPDDINTTFIEHKRYTMADIAKLERKLDALEENYSLTFAELEAKLDQRLDSISGVPIPETGIQIDEFTDQSSAFTEHDDYCAALDPENKLLRPCYEGNNLRLVYRPVGTADWESRNILIKGDNAYIDHVDSAWIAQPLATESVSINPNAKIDYIGDMELSPSSDEWKSDQRGTRAIGGANRLDTKEALLYNSWQWNWGGRAIEDEEVDEQYYAERVGFGRKGLNKRKKATSQRRRRRLGGTGSHINRVVSSDTVRTINNTGRAVDLAVVPWVRSRKIRFRATGLKPNTTFIPFFDGVNVSAWCNDESFARWSGRDDDLGNQGEQYTSGHPDGSAALVSDSFGKLEGSFFIPNVKPSLSISSVGLPTLAIPQGLRFKAGKKEFKLMDVNVPDHNQAGSYATAIYDVSGMISTRKDGMTTTRQPIRYRNNESRIRRAYNVKELKNYLDQVAAPDVDLIEPHISGGWGGDAPINVNVGSLGGAMSQVLLDYVSVDQNSQAGTSILPDLDISFPFAQSFTVDNQFGVVLTKVELFFETKASDLPVTVEIRNMVNGKPGNLKVPGTTVTLEPSSVQDNTDFSTILPTTFTFDEPCYLDPGREYALVVKSQSPDYKVWISRSGDYLAGSTGVRVSTQASNGRLFLPHSGRAGTSKDLDLAFNLYRAVFETNASLVLRNAVVPSKLLDANPIQLEDGSTSAYVKLGCHGLDVGEDVTISGVPVGSYGNLTETAFNKTHTVLAVDAHGFTITVADPGVDARIGGTAVLSTRNIQFITANPQIESVVPNKTSIDVSARFTSGKSLGGSETKFIKETKYKRIVPDQNVVFEAPRVVAQRSVETDGTKTINGLGGFSIDVKIDLKSSNDFVAPIIDLQRASMTLVQHCIDNGSYINPIAETVPYGSSSPSQHITTPMETVEPSTVLETTVDANVPNVANLDFYFRAVMAGENILDKAWTELNPVNPIVKSDDPAEMSTIKFSATDLPAFNTSQIKAVMRSTSMAKTPSIGKIMSRTFLQ